MTAGKNDPGDRTTLLSERRQAVRYACILGAVDLHGQRAFMPAWLAGWPIRVLDMSKNGIGLHAADQLDEGAVLTLSLYGRTDKPSAPHQVRIVRAAQQTDGTWIAGAVFIEPIGDDELQMLLGASGTDDSQ